LAGHEGNDVLNGGAGADWMTGGAGDDTIYFDDDDTGFWGEDGYDTLIYTGSLGLDLDLGSLQAESIRVGSGDDTISGSGSADEIWLGGGNDLSHGWDGDDVIYGEAGDDGLAGHEGNDVLNGGAGADWMTGGAGDDTIYFDDDDTGFWGEDGYDTLIYTGSSDLVIDIASFGFEAAKTGSGNDDVLAGDEINEIWLGGGNDVCRTYDGNDVIYGEGGDDELMGANGDDILDGGSGADTLSGGDGIDTASYGTATAGVTADLDDSSNNTGDAAGDVYWDIENLAGSSFNDVLRGTSAANVLNGGGGSDILVGNGGYDTYMIKLAAGDIVVDNRASDGVTTANGEIDFGTGISASQLWFAQVGNDLRINVLGASEHVTISEWYGSAARAQVQEFDTADGLKLDTQLAQLTAAMASYSAANPGFDPTTAPQMPVDSNLQSAISAAWHA
jgi:Ca2+-binding RTX toxin-like protein